MLYFEVYDYKGKMKMSKKVANYLYGFLAFLAAEGIQIVVVGMLAIVYRLIGSHGGMETDQNVLYIISVIAAGICGIAFAVWYYGITQERMRMERKGRLLRFLTRKNVRLLMGLGLGCQLFTTGIMSLVQSYFIKTFEEYSGVLELLTSGSMGLVLLFTVVIAPVSEELIFRGVIFRLVGRMSPFYAANIFQAILFGIYHGNIVQGIYGASLGLILGYTMAKYRTITAPILLHMLINASAFLVNILPSSTISFLLMTAIGGALTVLGIRRLRHTEMNK